MIVNQRGSGIFILFLKLTLGFNTSRKKTGNSILNISYLFYIKTCIYKFFNPRKGIYICRYNKISVYQDFGFFISSNLVSIDI